MTHDEVLLMCSHSRFAWAYLQSECLSVVKECPLGGSPLQGMTWSVQRFCWSLMKGATSDEWKDTCSAGHWSIWESQRQGDAIALTELDARNVVLGMWGFLLPISGLAVEFPSALTASLETGPSNRNISLDDDSPPLIRILTSDSLVSHHHVWQ